MVININRGITWLISDGIYIDSSRGDRIYKLQPGSAKGVVYSVDSIVRNITGIKFKSYCSGKYTLGKQSVRRLTNYLS